jgi:hypothetical protein
LWKFAPATFDAQYFSTYSIATAGLHASAGEVASQQTYTFRTIEGGIMKVVLNEQPQSQWAPLSYAGLSADQQAFVDFFTDDSTSYWLARDTSYPHIFLKLFGGYNESLFRKRFR